MNWRDTLFTASDAVRSHRLRSALTMLGILIGITAVILTVGIGRGARADVQDQIDELGTNVLVVSPGSSTDDSGVRGGFGTASTLTMGDADALADDVVAPDVEAVAATATSTVSLTAGETNWTTTLTGTTRSWQDVRSRATSSGRFWTQREEEDAASVTVLGPDTVTELGLVGNPVGQTVSVDGTELEVIGVLEALSSSDDTSNNDVALVPFATYSHRLVGGEDRDSVSSIYVKASEGATLSAAYQETAATLRNLHGITDDDVDFSIATQESLLTAASSVDRTLTVMLSGIAVISLLVGWHRGHEHHAGLGHGADPGDRPPQGPRRAAPAHPPPVPRRGLAPRPRRWSPRRHPRCRRRPGPPAPRRRPGPPVAAGVGPGHRHGHRHRRPVRRVPRVTRRPPRPHRRPPE